MGAPQGLPTILLANSPAPTRRAEQFLPAGDDDLQSRKDHPRDAVRPTPAPPQPNDLAMGTWSMTRRFALAVLLVCWPARSGRPRRRTGEGRREAGPPLFSRRADPRGPEQGVARQSHRRFHPGRTGGQGPVAEPARPTEAAAPAAGTYDLTGLPPTCVEAGSFSPTIRRKRTRRSWTGCWRRRGMAAAGRAHHEADLVRYAETDGFKADDLRWAPLPRLRHQGGQRRPATTLRASGSPATIRSRTTSTRPSPPGSTPLADGTTPPTWSSARNPRRRDRHDQLRLLGLTVGFPLPRP